MSESLGNIYDRSVAIVLEIAETCFLTKYFSKSYIYVFFLSKKQQKTQEFWVIESCPTPWVMFLIFC